MPPEQPSPRMRHLSWAAITSIAEKIGCAAETLRSWVRQAERDGGSAARADDGRRGSSSSNTRTSSCGA